MTTMFIPDPNSPQRVPDGQVGDFYFWLGDDFAQDDLVGDVDEPEFDFENFDPEEEFKDD
jgi:hypothetical protein